MTKSKTPKNKKIIERLRAHQAKKINGGGGEKKVVGGVMEPIEQWPYITIDSEQSNKEIDENAPLQNLILNVITNSYTEKDLPDNIKYDDEFKKKFESKVNEYNAERKKIKMLPLIYNTEVNEDTREPGEVETTFKAILQKIKDNKEKQENNKKNLNNLQEEEAKKKKAEEAKKKKVEEAKKNKAEEAEKRKKEAKNKEAKRKEEKQRLAHEEAKNKEAEEKEAPPPPAKAANTKPPAPAQLPTQPGSVTQQQQQELYKFLKEADEIVSNTDEYTLEKAKDVATNDKFIKLLEYAMNDTKAHQIQWEKITPDKSKTSQLKRLAIQDILKESKPQESKAISKSSPNKLKNIPILLGIKNGYNREGYNDLANLCGYLLDYVFSQKREGEEFVLLSMYVAVNIDNDCFKKYIQNKEKTSCNTAFENMAKLLNLSYNAGTDCKSEFKTALEIKYGENYKSNFKTIIKNKDINVNEKLKELNEKKIEEFKKEEDASKQAFEKQKILESNAATKIQSIVRSKKAKEEYNSLKERKKIAETISLKELKQIAEPIAKILQERAKRKPNEQDPEIFTDNPILKDIAKNIIDNTNNTDVQTPEWNILGNYKPLLNSKEYFTFIFDDLKTITIENLTESRDKLLELYRFFRGLVYLDNKPATMTTGETSKFDAQEKELTDLLEQINDDNMKDIEKEIKKILTEDFETLSELKKDLETGSKTGSELIQIKLNILRQFDDNVFLKVENTYIEAKKILNKLNLYRMILDIYIISKDDETSKTSINKAWGTRADIKVARLFYMVLEWFNSMKNEIPNNKICELNPVEASDRMIKWNGQSYLEIGEGKSNIECDTALNISFTEKLTFLKNYNSLIQETVFTKYYKYLNNTYGKGGRVYELTGRGKPPQKVFDAFKAITTANGKHKYTENNENTENNEITGLKTYDLGETLQQSMTTHFSNITKGYHDDKLQGPDDFNKALEYARYIDVIKALKEKKDYKVDGEYMTDAVNDYIQDGTKGALDFIKSRKENDYIAMLKEKNKQEKENEKEKGQLWMA